MTGAAGAAQPDQIRHVRGTLDPDQQVGRAVQPIARQNHVEVQPIVDGVVAVVAEGGEERVDRPGGPAASAIILPRTIAPPPPKLFRQIKTGFLSTTIDFGARRRRRGQAQRLPASQPG